MVQTTATVAEVQGTAEAALTVEQQAAGAAVASRGPWWAEASPAVRECLAKDAAWVVVRDGLSEAEYLEGLVEWPDGVLAYLAESGLVPAEVDPVVAAAAAAVAEGEAKAAAAEAEEAAMLAESKAARKAGVAAYRRGEKALCAGRLEAGRQFHRYAVLRMALRFPRSNAVSAVMADLAECSTEVVNAEYVNRLMAAGAAATLLAEVLSTAGTVAEVAKVLDVVPWTHYRDSWCRVVERVAKDTPQEHYVLLPGLEQECRKAFGNAVTQRLPLATVKDDVQRLCQLHATRQAEAAAKAKAAAQAEAATARANAEAEQNARLRAEAAAKAAVAAVAAVEHAPEEQRPVLAEAAEQAKAELLACQEAERVAVAESVAKAAAAERERKAAAEAAAAQAKAADKAAKAAKAAADKAEAKAAKGNPATPAGAAGQTPGLPTVDKRPPAVKDQLGNATPKDAAVLLLEFVANNDAPEDVLVELVRLYSRSGDCSRTFRAAADSLVMVWERRTKTPTPVQVAEAKAAPSTPEAAGRALAAAILAPTRNHAQPLPPAAE
jgi:hypothetical protein